MRIWDIHPGYLNRQSLLGEHRELHGIVSILSHGKKGYANHPETLRWQGYGWALSMRHRQLACEMQLRGYQDRSPVLIELSAEGIWPGSFIDSPENQYVILAKKYQGKDEGRIPLPRNSQQLWAQHKYSVMARSVQIYREIGVKLAKHDMEFAELASLFLKMLRQPPTAGGLRNSLQHMWGYVANPAPLEDVNAWTNSRLLDEVVRRVKQRDESYLSVSTALSDFWVWLAD